MNIRNHAVAGALTIVFCLLAAGSGKSSDQGASSDRPSSTGQSQTSAPSPPTPQAKSYDQVAAATLMSDYKANEVRADEKWKDHYVAVTGVVDDIKKNAFGDIYVLLGTGAQFELNAIHCEFAKNLTTQAAALNKGQHIVVYGKVSGMILTSVIIHEAQLTP